MKRISSLLLVFLLVFSDLSICSLAANEIPVIEFYNGENRILTMEPGINITARVRVTDSFRSSNAVFVLMLVMAHAIVDLAVDHKKSEIAGDTTLSAEIKTPPDITGCFLKAVLWESLSSMKPYISAGIFPDYSNTLKNMKVNGEYFTGFDTGILNYFYDVGCYENQAPYITAAAFNGAAKVEVKTTMSFPGKSHIKVTAADGTASDYDISYRSNFNAQDYISNFECPGDPNARLNFDLDSNSHTYKNNTYVTYENISEELKGSAYIQFGEDYKAGGGEVYDKWAGAETDWLGFELKRTARIFVISDEAMDQFAQSGEWSYEKKTFVQKLDVQKGEYTDQSHLYSKKIEVDGTPEKITIPNGGNASSPYSVFIRFEYSEVLNDVYTPEIRINNLRYCGPYNSGSEYYFDYPKHYNNFKDGVLLFNNYTELIVESAAEELIGCDYIIMSSPIKGTNPAFIKNAWGGAGINWMSFDLHKSAKVKVFTNSGNINAFKDNGFLEKISPTKYFNLYNTTWNTATAWNTMYEKEFTVTDSPVTVILENPYGQGNRWGYIIVLEYTGD